MPFALQLLQRRAPPRRPVPALSAPTDRAAAVWHLPLFSRPTWPFAVAAQRRTAAWSRRQRDTASSPPMLYRSEGFAEDLLDA